MSHVAGGHLSWANKGGKPPAYLSKPSPQYAYLPPSSSYPLARPSSALPAQPSHFPVPFHLQHQQQQLNCPQQHQPAQAPGAHASQFQFQYQYQPLYQPAPELYAFPHAQQQAQQLFQRDAQTITPEALESVKAALASGDGGHRTESKKKAIPRKAAGQTWEDPTLADWPENDYRLFCGDLGNEVNDEVLTKAFSRFSSFSMARVVRDKRTGKTRGYGFVSFINSSDLALALKEMNGKYVGNRPIKLRKSTWKERNDVEAVDRQKVLKRVKTMRKNVLHR